jgi:hypothetical protein
MFLGSKVRLVPYRHLWADSLDISQPYRPPRPVTGDSLIISVTGWVNSMILVRLEGWAKLTNFNYLIGTQTRNLPACSIGPQATTLTCAHQMMNILKENFIIRMRKTGFNIPINFWNPYCVIIYESWPSLLSAYMCSPAVGLGARSVISIIRKHIWAADIGFLICIFHIP